MKVRVCEDERMKWTGEGQGGGGEAGLTAQRQRCLVPPGFLLKTRPPFPPAHLTPVSPLSPPPPLSPSLSSVLLLSRPSFTLQFLHFFFSHFLRFSSPPPPPPFPRLGHYRHSAAGREAGVGGCGIGMGRLRGGTKALRCSGPPRVAGFEKKPDGFLMQRLDGQTQPFILVL
ncbi:hypothetical protein NQZ68_004859 [Dissostichus eleginoides]|nr:hypothetical protein NQZ68_004859 [Dissostichus eleginoides]